MEDERGHTLTYQGGIEYLQGFPLESIWDWSRGGIRLYQLFQEVG
jgi:hypothetical protein